MNLVKCMECVERDIQRQTVRHVIQCGYVVDGKIGYARERISCQRSCARRSAMLIMTAEILSSEV